MRLFNSLQLAYRYLFFTILFLCALLAMRWAWLEWLPIDKSFRASDGVVDLRGVDLASTPFTLDGEWEWYPHRLLTGGQAAEAGQAQRIQVPGNWKSVMSSNEGNAYGYGTYRLRILVDPLEQPIALWIKNIQASSEVEINGAVLGGAGEVAENAGEYKPYNSSYRLSYSEKGSTEIELLIRSANYDSPFSGGIMRSVRFGSERAVNSIYYYSLCFQLMIVVIMFLHALYIGIVYFYKRNDSLLLVTGLVFFLVGIAVFSGHDKTMLLWLPLNYTWLTKIRISVLLWQNICILLFYRMFAGYSPRSRGLRVYLVSIAILTAVVLVAPVSIANSVTDTQIFLAAYLISYIWIGWSAVVMFIRRQEDRDSRLLLLTCVCILFNLAWSIADSFSETMHVYYPLDLAVAVIFFSAYWFLRYLRNTDKISDLYEKLQISDKMKDRFLASTSHELRTPLHGIMNITGSIYAREKHKLEETSLREMELVGTVSRRMSRLLDDLLDIARLQEHQVVLRPEPVSVQAIVPGILAMLKHMAEGKPIRLEMRIDDSAPPVWADEKRFVQILYNLLHNALKYTEQGSVRVSLETGEGYAEIQVSDTGAGMDEETKARIFMPYVQGDYGIRDGRGIGLGLSICKQLVELHGSGLQLDSVQGQGSTFRFRLPLADKQVASPPTDEELSEREVAASQQAIAVIRYPEDEKEYGTIGDSSLHLLSDREIRILAVDDEPINLKVLEGILSSEPYILQTVCSGQEALELLESGNWDLLIADVMMPGMSGYELTQRVRERYAVSELPVLLLTARSQPADIYTGFLAGANDYMTKPADAVELRYRIRALILLKQSIQDRLRIEAAYLQAQIHPHFLFNTLNSLMALSEIDTERMRALGDAFTSFLRISFDYLNTGETVDLEHELQLVEAYLYIEQERFGEKLKVIREVEPNLRVELPPLSIQPLVENAVKHGLLSRVEGGELRLRVIRTDRGILVEVKDNGIGMDPDRAARLLHSAQKEKVGGVGLANTHHRLTRLYGKGLSIDSRLGEGTTVSFVVPEK